MKQRLICLVGATGTGKTALALALAQKNQGDIINADSRQVYSDFPIITAQPTKEEQQHIPHRLYGYLATTEVCSAGTWSEAAHALILNENQKHTMPILVGGTGLYLRALLDGIVTIPHPSQELAEKLDNEFTVQGGAHLHQRLQAVDPEYAAKIHQNDRQRLIRALAVQISTGKPFTWWHQQTPPPPPFDVLRLGLDLSLAELLPRLIARIDNMLVAGAVEEVSKALNKTPDLSAPGWSGIGCLELAHYVLGKYSLDEARAIWIKNTRAYAKRQRTWFRADSRICWFRPEELDQALCFVQKHVLDTVI